MEVIVKLLFGPIVPSFAFLIPSTTVANSKGNPFFGGGAKILWQWENSVIFD